MLDSKKPAITVSVDHHNLHITGDLAVVGNLIIDHCLRIGEAGKTGDTPMAPEILATIKDLVHHRKIKIYPGRKVTMTYTTEHVVYSCHLYERTRLSKDKTEYTETERGIVTVTSTRPTYDPRPPDTGD